MMEIMLGLDLGEARIGVAISDELGIAAHPLCTIHRRDRQAAIAILEALIAEHGVQRIVIGLPVRLNGEVGIQAEKVKAFAATLQERVNLPVSFWDESFTTVEASRILRQSKKRGKKRKQVVDQVAAVLILNGYLEQVRNTGRRDGLPA